MIDYTYRTEHSTNQSYLYKTIRVVFTYTSIILPGGAKYKHVPDQITEVKIG